MIKILSFFLFLSLSFSSLANAEQCKIVSNTVEKSLELNLPFKNVLQKDLEVYTPIPTSSLVSNGVVYVFEDKKHIGIFKYFNDYFKGKTPEETIKNVFFFDCDKPITQIIKSDFKFLIVNDKNTMADNLEKIQVYILAKDDSYYYHLTFAGFSKDEVIQMLIRK